jgi:hypothetical protein
LEGRYICISVYTSLNKKKNKKRTKKGEIGGLEGLEGWRVGIYIIAHISILYLTAHHAHSSPCSQLTMLTAHHAHSSFQFSHLISILISVLIILTGVRKMSVSC